MTRLSERYRRLSSEPSWRTYQKKLQRSHRPKTIAVPKPNLRWTAILVAVAILGIWAIWPSAESSKKERSTAQGALPPTDLAVDRIQKKDVHIFLGSTDMVNVTTRPLTVQFDGKPYRVETSLDLKLQQYLLDRMDRENSRYIGIVAMEPTTGKIIAMAGFNKIDPDQDPCLVAEYPAASIFKIITAAAAVEEKGYSAGSRFTFNGYKHTLYKRQLTDKTNRYTNSISFRDAFAQSVNPVFGKIGALYMTPGALKDYGEAFAFNRNVNFELPWPQSHLTVKDESYNRAEIASGFNRQTTISPLHGAMIVSAVLNGGAMVEPTLVDRITDASGETVYLAKPNSLAPAVSSKTADVLEQLMVATVSKGTARKPFRGRSRNKVLSKLRLGGKTGSIYNRAHDARFDWFVGFAEEKKGDEKMVVSVMVAHEEYIGTRATQYARWAIEHHFKDYFANKTAAGRDSSG